MKRFIVDGRYKDLFAYYGMNIDEALKKAGLPGDIFAHRTPTMTEEQYFRFMEVMGEMMTDPGMPIQIACTNKIESFSPPIFASYCSKNGEICIERLARHKKLIGPLRLITEKDGDAYKVEITTESGVNELPTFVVETEFAFLVNIIRRASQENVIPKAVFMKKPVKAKEFSDFLGVKVKKGEKNELSFSLDDLHKPFISYDEAMWNYFEPELSKRLSEMEVDDTTSARVRSAITEMLPGGICGIEDVAARLGLSKRTLQRKLADEGTNFQQQLNNTRELLAKHYLKNTEMSSDEIAYLLGYQELNSFLRAFTVWTGESITEFKKSGGADL